MAEPLAIVGLVAAIVQFVDFSSKVLSRLHDFQSSRQTIPKAFRDINNQLPLLIDTLNRIQSQASCGSVNEGTAKALKPVVDACLAEARRLGEILDEMLPKAKASSWQRRIQAIRSLASDGKIQEINVRLERNIHLLTLSQTTRNSDVAALVEEQQASGESVAKPPAMMKRKSLLM